MIYVSLYHHITFLRVYRNKLIRSSYIKVKKRKDVHDSDSTQIKGEVSECIDTWKSICSHADSQLATAGQSPTPGTDFSYLSLNLPSRLVVIPWCFMCVLLKKNRQTNSSTITHTFTHSHPLTHTTHIIHMQVT